MVLEYRIIKKTFGDGRIAYSSQVRNFFLGIPIWKSLTDNGSRYDSEHHSRSSKEFSNRSEAISAIDKNIERIKRSTVKSIDYKIIFKEI